MLLVVAEAPPLGGGCLSRQRGGLHGVAARATLGTTNWVSKLIQQGHTISCQVIADAAALEWLQDRHVVQAEKAPDAVRVGGWRGEPILAKATPILCNNWAQPANLSERTR